MVEKPDLVVTIQDVYLDPETDEMVVVSELNGETRELRRGLPDYFPTDADVTLTDDLNIRVEGEGYVRIQSIPDALTPPTEEA